MKKKRFYNNKKRNTKWTEPVRGRKIDFADKYIEAGTGSDKFDRKRPKKRKKYFTAERAGKLVKGVIVAACCFLIISVGYGAMDLYMERNAMPDEPVITEPEAGVSSLDLEIRSVTAQPLSLDGGVMLEAVINNAQQKGYTSVTFDIKRDDGTIGYESSLATIDAYGAISSASADLEGSVSMLLESDLLPVARISCYKDNIASRADVTAAVTDGAAVYRDSEGNAYLNPESSITYNYIKGIIEETKSMGITVFLLDNTDLPEDIAEEYNDGFDALERRLYVDFGDEIKLLSSTEIRAFEIQTVTGGEQSDSETRESTAEERETQPETAAADENSASASTDGEDENSIEYILSQNIKSVPSDAAYRILTNSEDRVKAYLDDEGITNYVIVPQEEA